MEANRLALVVLAVGVLLGDLWMDWSARLSAAQAISAAVRTALLVLTVWTLVRPTRPLVLVTGVALLLAVVRRGLFLAPLLPTLIPGSALLVTFHSGLDLAFRLVLLGWVVAWLRKGGSS